MCLCTCFNLSAYFRTYVRDIINASEIMSGGVKNAYYHYAAFHDREFGSRRGYLASCFTYIPQHRVPPGEQHKVFKMAFIKKLNLIQMQPSKLQLGMFLDISNYQYLKVYVFIYNINQGRTFKGFDSFSSMLNKFCCRCLYPTLWECMGADILRQKI